MFSSSVSEIIYHSFSVEKNKGVLNQIVLESVKVYSRLECAMLCAIKPQCDGSLYVKGNDTCFMEYSISGTFSSQTGEVLTKTGKVFIDQNI